jgi:hypothetical protein
MTMTEYTAAEKAAEKLSQQSEESLMFELGKRIEDSKQPGGEERMLKI